MQLSVGGEIILMKRSVSLRRSFQSACSMLVCVCFFFAAYFFLKKKKNYFLGVGNSPNLEDQVLSPISPVDVVPGLKKEDDVPAGPASEVGVVKANKGMILRKSVEYIR